tara:strand:- start:1470 stop:2093 length:624 start_codon:yes stop_codon:yes gene_type:complete
MAIRTAVNRALTAITALPTAAALTDGNLTLLTTATASSSATLTFDSNINSTYNSYLFKFIDIHPASESSDAHLCVNFRDGGSNYDATKTTTYFDATHSEADSTSLAYSTSHDLVQGTGVAKISSDIGADNDQAGSGTLQLFDPSSTTFVKHFISRVQIANAGDSSQDTFVAGYANVTAAIDGVQFTLSNSANIDSGTIKMYGVGPKQ